MPDVTLTQAANHFRRSLKKPFRKTMVNWSALTFQRLYQALKEGKDPRGVPLAPLAAWTVKFKQRMGFDNRIGVRTKILLNSLTSKSGGIRMISFSEANVGGWSGGAKNFNKARLLINGRGPVTQTYKSWGGKTYTRTISGQPPRDYVGHDDTVIEAAGDYLLDRILRTTWEFS